MKTKRTNTYSLISKQSLNKREVNKDQVVKCVDCNRKSKYNNNKCCSSSSKQL